MKQLFLLLLISAYAHGQNNIFPIDVRVLALGSAAQIPERYLSTKEGYEKIVFSNRQANQLIKATTGEMLPIFAKVSDPQSKSAYRVAEQVKLPPDTKSILLLCWGSQETGLRYLPINDSILEVDYNNWLMINTTPKAVGIRIGENTKPVFLEPNSIKQHQITIEKGKGVPVVGRAKFNGVIKTFYSTYWKVRENERSILIFTEVGSKIKITRIGDRLQKKEETIPQRPR